MTPMLPELEALPGGFVLDGELAAAQERAYQPRYYYGAQAGR